jgi:hypothetical protein
MHELVMPEEHVAMSSNKLATSLSLSLKEMHAVNDTASLFVSSSSGSHVL